MRRLLATGTILLLAALTLARLASADELSGEIKTWTKKGMLAGATATVEDIVELTTGAIPAPVHKVPPLTFEERQW